MRRTLLTLLGFLLVTLSLASPSAHAATTKITPKITMAAATNLTYDHRTTTVTGTVTAVFPDGTTGPLAQQVVQISCYYACTDGNVTTDNAGQFTVAVTAGWWEISVTAAIAASDSVAAYSTSIWLYPHSDTRMTASVSPSTISAASHTATFSGVLEYLGDDSTWKPLPGRTIRIDGAGAAAQLTAGADGSFTSTVTLTPSAGATQQVRVWWTPWGNPTTTTDETFFKYAEKYLDVYTLFNPTISGINGSMSASGRVSLSGSVTGATRTVPVQIEYSSDGSTGWTTADTIQTSGDFTSTFTAPAVPAYYRAEIVATDAYTGAVSGTIKVDKAVTAISGFAASVDAGGTLSVKGTVAGAGTAVPVQIEYSANGKTGWRTATTVQTGGAFSTTLKAPLPTAYYRAEIIAGTYYTGSTSGVAKAGRKITRIIGFNVSATKVKKNAYFTISGTLQEYSSGWKPLTKQPVWIIFHLKGSKTIYWYCKPVTGAGGRFTARIKAFKDAYWLPVFPGATGYYATAPSKDIFVTVR